MENANQNEDMLNEEMKNLKHIRNIHFSGVLIGTILSGYDFTMTIKEDKHLFGLGIAMVGYTIYHTLKTSKTITEIKNVQQKINQKKY